MTLVDTVYGKKNAYIGVNVRSSVLFSRTLSEMVTLYKVINYSDSQMKA